ncbi:hypothetical protein [Streptomyces longisporoflavus]|uniref:Uncharacterized protein n=1 Tax=Streptomyces longisporoflavus TaxID=28044 RepID=A0ABW7R5L1_9ACTN
MQLKPVPMDVIAEAREEADSVVLNLMARLMPGQHEARLIVTMEGQKPLTAVLPLTVEGDGSRDDMIGAEPARLENFAFLLTVALAQHLSSGVMLLRSTGAGTAGQDKVRVWTLFWGVLEETRSAEAADLMHGMLTGVDFADAFGVHSPDDDEDEAIYPPSAYRLL